MRSRTQRRLGLLLVLCLPLFMAASCDSNDLDTADGVIAIIIGVVQLVFTIINAF
ncbi:MAG: hypothetical protein IPK83_19765 [Planctomycetes bacterium]|nr:hypothetical protein [Planctomycetota bacterium]